MAVTVSSMIFNSLINIGEKAIGGSIDANEQAFYLDKMNAMLDSWSIDRTMVYTILQENFSLSVSTVSYTIGSGGVFNTARPSKIVNAFVRDSQNFDSPLKILQQPQYASIRVKSVGTTYPEALYYDAADVAGLATIYLYPSPVASLTLYINSYKSLPSFTAISTVLVLPPGYQRAIEANFSIEAAQGLTQVAPETIKIAKESKAAIRAINLPETISRMDSAIVGRAGGNIITGP